MNKIFDLTQKESNRQRDTLNLIASENYPSPKVLELLGSVWQNRYSEGYPGRRYYAGQVYTDELESYVQELAVQVFDKTGEYAVNVQSLSGSPANTMVYLAALQPGDTILGLDLSQGGHLSHIHDTSSYNQIYKRTSYHLKETTPNTFEIDWDDFAAQLEEHKPKLTIVGFSSYPRQLDFAKLCALAHAAGSLVLADIAHIAGLVAVGLHDSPFKVGGSGADYITTTTHKTLRGPRGALIFAKKPLMTRLNETVFPGTSGGPHLHAIAAIGQALQEITGEDSYPDNIKFEDYIQTVLDNARALEKGLADGGLTIISPTQTHLSLVKLPDETVSLEVQQKLEAGGVILNRNMLPYDTKSAWKPSGLRLGTAALTSRGLNQDMSRALGNSIADLILDQKPYDPSALSELLDWYY